MKKKSVKNLILRAIIFIFVVVLIVCLPSVNIIQNNELNKIYSVFLGSKSKYQGIIEIWNIDSFEGGTKSKTELLNEISKQFQKENKGLYFLVRNLSESECVNLMSAGELPDLISCSFGVAENFKDKVKAFSGSANSIEDSAKIAGQVAENQMAVAWCKSSYYIISTKDRLEKSGIEKIENIKLSNLVMSQGYVVKNKNKEKTVYSVSMGHDKYLMPEKAVQTYNKQGVNLISNYSFDAEKLKQTPYSAYCDFVAGKSTMLVGTKRDVFRMQNREKNGKVSDVIYEQVLSFSDLIQFMMISKNLTGDKLFYAEKFIEFLTSKKAQDVISKSGLFSVLKNQKIDDDLGVMQNITPQNFSIYETNNIFIEKFEISKLQKFDISF